MPYLTSTAQAWKALPWITWQAPSSSAQPKILDHHKIPLGCHLATPVTHTKYGVHLSLIELHARNRALA